MMIKIYRASTPPRKLLHKPLKISYYRYNGRISSMDGVRPFLCGLEGSFLTKEKGAST